MSQYQQQRGRSTRAPHGPWVRVAGVTLAAVALALPAPPAWAQGTAYVESSIDGADITAPLPAMVRADDRLRKITLVGRNRKGVLFTDDDTGDGARYVLDPDTIQEIRFAMEYEEPEVLDAVRREQWSQAIRVLLPVVKPTLPYLDLKNNNAAQAALDLGTYMMRSAETFARRGDSEAADVRERIEKRYAAAYQVFQDVAKARWSYAAKIAQLKRIQCLLALKKPQTAARLLEQVEPPFVGDAAFGLYWLTHADLEWMNGKVRSALDAAVRSLCFENKDIETFPDALLVSAKCYEKLEEWHRARDIYYELGRIFPNTRWQADAIDRLKFIRAEGLTNDEEQMPIENIFFGFKEDMNELVDALLEQATQTAPPDVEEETTGLEDIDLRTAD